MNSFERNEESGEESSDNGDGDSDSASEDDKEVENDLVGDIVNYSFPIPDESIMEEEKISQFIREIAGTNAGNEGGTLMDDGTYVQVGNENESTGSTGTELNKDSIYGGNGHVQYDKGGETSEVGEVMGMSQPSTQGSTGVGNVENRDDTETTEVDDVDKARTPR